MNDADETLRADVVRIWQAGLEGVRSERLMRQKMRVEGRRLFLRDERPIDLDRVRRILVVGAGKAGTGMATAVEEILGPAIMEEKQLDGWVNVPADCVRPLRRIQLHAARPAGCNEPTADGVAGSEEILRRVGSLTGDDLCLALVSGGGSALLPAPVDGITLADKVAVTRHLSAAGADIRELNTVRKQLSRIKGGGLARACRAGRLVALVISDVLGDPWDLIASGPTVADHSTPADALAVLERYAGDGSRVPATVLDYLRQKQPVPPPAPQFQVTNILLGNNATAVEAAGLEAERLGYSCTLAMATQPDGAAEKIGRSLAEQALEMRNSQGPNCFISGGEAVVRLVDESQRGLGGRNQQTALAALVRLADEDPQGIAVLSAGTDGEDGPTDAAGAVVDAQVIARAKQLGLDPLRALRSNDAYHFFEAADALIKTGPTHTNVCDVRVVVVRGGRK